MATSFVNTNPQFTINTGGNFAPNAGGEVEFFSVGNTGDSNRKDTYNTPTPDATPTTAQINPNPVPLDSYGRFSVPVFLDGSYNTVVRDSAGNQIETKDNVTGEGAEGVSSLVVLNVAALRAVDTSLYTYATIEGTTTIDDGGQANFYYDSGSAAADNGTTIIEPTTGGGRWLVLNVETLAIGDDAVTTAKILDANVTTDKIADYNITQQKLGWYPLSVVDGLKVSNNSGTPTEVIDIAVGSIADTNQSYVMRLASAFTKSIAATWAVATGNGGCSNAADSGAVQPSIWYGVFIISKASDPTDCDIIFAKTKADSLADTNAVSAGFDISRLIGYVLTDGSGDITASVDGGDGWNVWDVIVKDSSEESTTRQSIVVPVPTFQIGRFYYTLSGATGGVDMYGLMTQTNQTDTAPSNSFYTAQDETGDGCNTVKVELKVDSLSQIAHRESQQGTGVRSDVFTESWKMDYTVTDLV